MPATARSVTTWRKSTHSSANNGNCVEVGTWRKSTYSGSNGSACVEVAAWRKSTHSGTSGNGCVEVGAAAPAVQVRDTTNRTGAILTFAPATWHQFTATLSPERKHRKFPLDMSVSPADMSSGCPRTPWQWPATRLAAG